MVLRLAWSPHWLAHTAVRCSMARAAGLGFIAGGVPIVAPVAAQFGSISEPYRDLADYVHESLAAAPFVLVIALGVWCLYALACDLVAARAHADPPLPSFAYLHPFLPSPPYLPPHLPPCPPRARSDL